MACAFAYGQETVSEDELKAAFIFHFINFIEWDDNQPAYYICVPENEALRAVVRGSLNGKAINSKKIIVVNRTNDCSILFSDQSPQVNTTLTIGQLAKGAMLEFRIVEDKLKFAINFELIKKSKLKISSQMLKLAILEKGL